MIIGGSIMILGVLVQVTSFKGHNATVQLIIGRTITGVGNGIVSLNALTVFALPNLNSWTRLLTCVLIEHIHNSNIPS